MTAPSVANFTPTPGTTIEAGTEIAFDVLEAGGSFVAIVVVVKFPGGPWECAYDGSDFGPNYADESTVASITHGFHFVLGRAGGWAGMPTLLVHAIDSTGAEAP